MTSSDGQSVNTDIANSATETERYRHLLNQERRRVQQLSLINAVQRHILSTPEISVFLPQVARALAQHFASCRVEIYLLDPLPFDEGRIEESSTLKLFTHAGRQNAVIQYSAPHAEYENLRWLSINEKRVVYHDFTQSTTEDSAPSPAIILEVPFVQENSCLGVLELTSNDLAALSPGDTVVLRMIGTLLAERIRSNQINEEKRELSAFQQNLFSTMLQTLLVVDKKGAIRVANQRMYHMLGAAKEELRGAQLADVFKPDDLQKAGLQEAVRDVIQNGVPHELESARLTPMNGNSAESMIFDVRIFRVFYRGEPQAAVLLIDVTAHWRNLRQLQLMSDIGRFFSASLNIDTVLRTVLTCITAGNALGFNRAFLLLADEQAGQLKGTMALGPASATEAYRIWWELAQREWNLQQILDAAEETSQIQDSSPLQEKTRALIIASDNPLFPALQKALVQKRPLHIQRNELLVETVPDDISAEYRDQWENAAALFTAPEMALAPLHAKGRLVGVVLADNAFSGDHITESDVQLLNNLAGQAGLAIDNARTYQALQKAQKEVVNAERLAVVGDMTARLSHEIRNPLSTIGGFARRLFKKPDDQEAVKRYSSVIVEEADRLDELLNDLLSMANSNKLDVKSHYLHEITDKALLLADADIKSRGVRIEKFYDEHVPPILVDGGKLLQALLNIIRNGVQSMPDGGALRITTHLISTSKPKVEISINDDGKGMSQNTIEHIFDPFYSTKIAGSGLGLAITWRIIQDHGGSIEVQSHEGQGTTFIISLPLHAPLSIK